MTILISGGHLTPALAFIDYLKKNQPLTHIFFAGRKYSQEKNRQLSNESLEINKRSVDFIAFPAAKFNSNNPITIFAQLFVLVWSLIYGLYLITKIKPSVFLSFGGYVAVPLTIASWLLRVPIITHEQTLTASRANQFIAKFAHTVAVSHRSLLKIMPPRKTKYTGNLLRPALLKANPTKPEWFNIIQKIPILYITGGSQGSEIINTTISQTIKQLTKDWIVIHQCGNPSAVRSYETELGSIARKLSRKFQNRYFIRPWITEQELAWIYRNASAIISRAGANTIDEILYFQIPSILIPLPFAHLDEQTLNAKRISGQNAAILLSQKELSPERLLESLLILNSNREKIAKIFHKLPKQPIDSADKLFKLIQKTQP